MSFVDTYLEQDTQSKIAFSTIYSLYIEECQKAKTIPISKIKFSQVLRRKYAMQQIRSTGGAIFFIGYKLKKHRCDEYCKRRGFGGFCIAWLEDQNPNSIPESENKVDSTLLGDTELGYNPNSETTLNPNEINVKLRIVGGALGLTVPMKFLETLNWRRGDTILCVVDPENKTLTYRKL